MSNYIQDGCAHNITREGVCIVCNNLMSQDAIIKELRVESMMLIAQLNDIRKLYEMDKEKFTKHAALLNKHNVELEEQLNKLILYSRKLYSFADMPLEDFKGTEIAKAEKLLNK